VRRAPAELTGPRRLALATLVFGVALGGIEGASRLTIWAARSLFDEEIRTTRDLFREQSDRIRALLAPDTSRLLALDSVLGWRYRSNHRDSVNQTNADGVRSARQYTRSPMPGILRVAAFGNSFVYCNEVKNEDAWPRLVEDVNADVEVLNYGVGGYGLDQAYLRFLAEGTRLSPRVVLIGFTPDDLGRVVNVYRRFRSNHEIPLVKPRYMLRENGELRLLPNPVRRPSDYDKYLMTPDAVKELGRYDQWYEPMVYEDRWYDYFAAIRVVTAAWIGLRRRYFGSDRLERGGVLNPSSHAFHIQVALFRRFADGVRASGAEPIVVFLPDRASVELARRGRRTVLVSLADTLDARRIEYLDATAAFMVGGQLSVDRWFMSGGHYSPLGNRLVAQWLGPRLRSRQQSRRVSVAPTPHRVRQDP